jgi:hypothetical protein
VGTNEVRIIFHGFRHILENNSALFSFFLELVIHDGRVILSTYSCEVFFFCFGDLETVEDVFDVGGDFFSGGSGGGKVFFGFGVVDDIFVV